MSKEKDTELEQNAGIRRREEELEKKRKQRIHKCVGLVCIVALLGVGAYISRIAYKDLNKNADQTAIAVNSMYFGQVTEETTDYYEQPLEKSVAEEFIESAMGQFGTETLSEDEVSTQESMTEESTEKENITEENTTETFTMESTAEDQSEMQSEVVTEVDQSQDNKTNKEVEQKKETTKKASEEEKVKEEKATEETKQTTEVKDTKNQYKNVSPTNLNLRSKPAQTAGVVGKIPPKAMVTVIDHNNKGWYHVSYNGMEGYVISTALVQK